MKNSDFCFCFITSIAYFENFPKIKKNPPEIWAEYIHIPNLIKIDELVWAYKNEWRQTDFTTFSGSGEICPGKT